MKGPAGVTALVLAEIVAGCLWLLFLTPLWNEVRRGFFTLTGSIVLVLAALAWYSATAGLVEGDEAVIVTLASITSGDPQIGIGAPDAATVTIVEPMIIEWRWTALLVVMMGLNESIFRLYGSRRESES